MSNPQPQTVTTQDVLGALVLVADKSAKDSKAAAESANVAKSTAAAAGKALDDFKAAKGGQQHVPIPGRREPDGSLRFQLNGQWWKVDAAGSLSKSEAPANAA